MTSWLVDQVDQAAKLLWNDSVDVIQKLLAILSAAKNHTGEHATPPLTIRKLLQELPRGGGSGLSPFHCIRKLSTFRAVWGRFGPTLDINAQDHTEKKTLLHHVARNMQRGHEYVKYLLKCNAAPDSRDRYGWTPLHEAARNGNESVMRVVNVHMSIVLTQRHRRHRQSKLHTCQNKYILLYYM